MSTRASPATTSDPDACSVPLSTAGRSVLEVDGGVGLQLLSLCSEMILRIVPLRERITSEWVVAPPAR